MAAEPAIVILGAGGFIGRALAQRLAQRGSKVTAVLRAPAALGPGIAVHVAGTLGARSDFATLFDGADAVVHLASRAHAPAGGAAWLAAETATAGALAAAARAAGVRRLVAMSSIKLHGNASGAQPFRAADPPAPDDSYGRTKAAIEAAMRAAFPDLVALRPPLVFGPGVKANFLALMRLVARGWPLPLAGVRNRRALIYIENLLDLVERALTHEAAAGHAFLMREDVEPAAPDLVRLIARGLGLNARLFACPAILLDALARVAPAARRLLDSAQIDDGPTRAALGWRPRVSLEDGVAATCRWFMAARP